MIRFLVAGVIALIFACPSFGQGRFEFKDFPDDGKAHVLIHPGKPEKALAVMFPSLDAVGWKTNRGKEELCDISFCVFAQWDFVGSEVRDDESKKSVLFYFEVVPVVSETVIASVRLEFREIDLFVRKLEDAVRIGKNLGRIDSGKTVNLGSLKGIEIRVSGDKKSGIRFVIANVEKRVESGFLDVEFVEKLAAQLKAGRKWLVDASLPS